MDVQGMDGARNGRCKEWTVQGMDGARSGMINTWSEEWTVHIWNKEVEKGSDR